MDTYTQIAVSSFLAGSIFAWREHRAGLSPAQRANIFWNDTRYLWAVRAFKVHLTVVALCTAGLAGVAMELWSI
jgi:hypothetical protein